MLGDGNGFRYVDVHSHAHEYSLSELEAILASAPLHIVIVSDDLESSRRTLDYWRRLEGRVTPCLGVHPWSVKSREAVEEARKAVELALENGVRCLGEVGLDTKFVGETIELQRSVFQVFLEAARDHNLILNLHTAGTWEEVLGLLERYDVGYANFHWYTGPLHLIPRIADHGYTISINPAIRVQKKHQNVVANAPLEIMLTESDAPYEYKGIKMSPQLVQEVVEHIARIKGLDVEYVAEAIRATFEKRWLRR